MESHWPTRSDAVIACALLRFLHPILAHDTMTFPTHNRLVRTHRPIRELALASVLALGLLGCSSSEGDDKTPTQVAAKVGDSEISVHQINQVLGRTAMRDASKEAVQATSKQILERLIDQQLAVDAATKDKLHRSPDVVAAIEAARNEVLARAYMQKFAASVVKASPDEIAQYYRDHPALFSERRIFNLQEIRLADAGGALAEVRKLTNESRRIEEIASLLRSKGVQFTGGSATRPAEQLPLELLPKIHALRDGEYLILEAGSGATIIRVAGSQQAPVTEDKARPAIEQFLNNRRISEAVAAEVKRMRGATTVAYMGEFGKPAGAQDAGTTPPSISSETTPTINMPTPAAAPQLPAADQDVLQRGIQGLK